VGGSVTREARNDVRVSCALEAGTEARPYRGARKDAET
jgi:hypothetical protein